MNNASSMTARQCVEAVLRGETPAKVPLTMYENKIPRCRAERLLRNAGLCVVNRHAQVFTTKYPNVKIETISYTEGGKSLTRTEYRTPCGTLSTIWEPMGYTTWVHKRVFSGPEDYKAMLFMIEDMVFEASYDSFRASEDADGGESFFPGVIGYEPMQQLLVADMGGETFCMEWFENRDEIIKLYDALLAKRYQQLEIAADSPAMAVHCGGNVTPEIVGRERFEQYYMPYYDQAGEILHAKGKKMMVHFDANTKIIAEAIGRSKIDVIEAFTPAPGSDMTMGEARQAWPDKILWLNFPSALHLDGIEAVRAAAADILRQAGTRERFIMGITEDIPQETWQENMLAISDVLNK